MSDEDQTRLAKITEDVVDDGQFISHQVSYLGKEANGIVFYPYGFHANAPPESWALMLSIQSHPDNRALLVSEPKIRPTLKPGEVALYSPLIPGLIITLQEDEQLSIKSPVKVLVEAPEIECIASVKVLVDAPDIELKGNVKIIGNLTIDKTVGDTDGDLTVAGDTALSATVTSNTKNISDDHTHIGSPTAMTGSQSPTGVVN